MHSLEIQDDEQALFDDDRTHFIDNLRMTVTALLIVQHTITETASSSYPNFYSLPLTTIVCLTKAVVVGLFFFISGYSASISRAISSSHYARDGKTDGQFIWSRTIRLLLPALAYGAAGHQVLWMFLKAVCPTTFGSAGSVPFSRFEGPVVHLLFLYLMDVAYVLVRPAKRHLIAGGVSPPSPKSPPSRPRSPEAGTDSERIRKLKSRIGKVRTPRDWYLLVSVSLGLLILWTFATAACGSESRSLLRFGFKATSYDTIAPSSPFLQILAYMAGTRLYKWQNSMIIPSPYPLPAFIGSIFISVSILFLGMISSPTLREIVRLDNLSPVHPAFIDGGFNFHTLFFAVWSTSTFFMISASLVSLFAQCRWTRKDWGTMARHTYFAVWFHMVPVVIFVKLLALDGRRLEYKGISVAGKTFTLTEEHIMWRSFLASAGSVFCSWLAGLGVAGVGWLAGRCG